MIPTWIQSLINFSLSILTLLSLQGLYAACRKTAIDNMTTLFKFQPVYVTNDLPQLKAITLRKTKRTSIIYALLFVILAIFAARALMLPTDILLGLIGLSLISIVIEIYQWRTRYQFIHQFPVTGDKDMYVTELNNLEFGRNAAIANGFQAVTFVSYFIAFIIY